MRKVAIVTGAARGIGLATTRLFLAAGVLTLMGQPWAFIIAIVALLLFLLQLVYGIFRS